MLEEQAASVKGDQKMMLLFGTLVQINGTEDEYLGERCEGKGCCKKHGK